MSSWPSDFRDAYARHPLSAVMMLAAVILAFTFVSTAFAVRFDSPPLGGSVTPSTAVVRPAQGQAPGRHSPGRPGSAPTTPPFIPAVGLLSPRTDASAAPRSVPARTPTRTPTRTPITVQPTSAPIATPPASPTTTPPTTNATTPSNPPTTPPDTTTPTPTPETS